MKKIAILLFMLVLTACHTVTSSNTGHHYDKTTAAQHNIHVGMTYLKEGQLVPAKQKLLLALHEAPQLPEAWSALGYFFEVRGERQRAKECYRRAHELRQQRGDGK